MKALIALTAAALSSTAVATFAAESDSSNAAS